MNLVPLLVAIPLAGGFLMPILGRLSVRGRSAAVLPILMAAAMLVLSVLLLATPDAKTPPYWVGAWDFPVGISLVADGLSKLLLVVINVISLLALVFSLDYMARYTKPDLYYSLFMLMLAGMNGVVLAGDLFNLFVFLEVAAIASYALVAFGTEADELEASMKYLVLGAISSAFILIGIAVMYNVTGHLNWAKIAALVKAGGGPTLPVYLAAAFFLMGFGLKAAMVPFHAWLPDAHPSAPAPISAMLSGVLIKACGVYVLCRLVCSVFGGHEPFGMALLVLGVLSMVLGALMAIGQSDLKRLLAYSSISQVGYVVLALGTGVIVLARWGGDPAMESLAFLAFFAGLFHLVNHAVFKGLLFLCSGSIEQATGTRRLSHLAGLGSKMPVTGWSLRAGALAISGIPPFGGFWSKLLIILALVRAGADVHWGFYVPAALAAATAVITLAYYAKVQRDVLGGDPSPAVMGARPAPRAMQVASVALAVLCLATALIVVPAVRVRLVDPAIHVLAGTASGSVSAVVQAPAGAADSSVSETPAVDQENAAARPADEPAPSMALVEREVP